MIIGVPREIKEQEDRVALTPAGVDGLIRAGHRVLVETNAGLGSSFTDEEYKALGAEILPEASMVWKQALIDEIPLRKGANIIDGKVVYKAVADAFDLPFVPVEEVLGC